MNIYKLSGGILIDQTTKIHKKFEFLADYKYKVKIACHGKKNKTQKSVWEKMYCIYPFAKIFLLKLIKTGLKLCNYIILMYYNFTSFSQLDCPSYYITVRVQNIIFSENA